MQTLRRNPNFMIYMPNIFLKKEPPADFFWKVYSAVCPDDFKRGYDANMDRIKRKIAKPQTVYVMPEAKTIMEIQKQESIRLLMQLKRPYVNDNIVYLRKTFNRTERIQQANQQMGNVAPQIQRQNVTPQRPT